MPQVNPIIWLIPTDAWSHPENHSRNMTINREVMDIVFLFLHQDLTCHL